MKKALVLVLMLAVVLTTVFCFVACDFEADTYEIAVVTDVGQLMDKGFNQGTWEGAKAFAEANNKTVKYYQPANGNNATNADRVAAMNAAITNGAKIIVAPGFLQAEAMREVAIAHPEVKFIFVDGWNITDKVDATGKDIGTKLPNVTAVVYKEQESGFLAGYAAVMDGYRKLGFTGGGGGTNPACNRFGYGFVQGAEAAAAALQLEAGAVEVKFSFKYGSTFSASNDLQTQIGGWYESGTEVVFACGGSMFESVKAAAALHTNAKIIGVDVDQSGASDRVITSAVKGLKESVQIVLGQFFEGKWDAVLGAKAQNLGAAENATGLPIATSRFTTFTENDYNALFAKIKDGTITPDANTPAEANKNADWLNAAVELVTIVFEA
jgi:basic membrane protein A